MWEYLQKIRPLLLLTLTLAYIGNALFTVKGLFYLTALLLVVILFLTLPLASPSNRRVSLLLLLLGGVLLFTSQVSLSQWVTALGANAGLVVLFVALPFFSFPLNYDDYEPALRDLSEKYVYTPFRFATFYVLLTFFLSAILNIGSFAIIHNLYKKSGAFKEQEAILWASMARGNIGPMFWSPSFIAVAVVLAYTYVPWVQLIPQGIILSLVVLATIWLCNIISLRKYNTLKQQPGAPSTQHFALGKLVAISLLLLGLVAVFNIFTDLNILVIIPLVGMIYSLLLAFLQGKFTSYREQLKHYYRVTLPNVRNEVAIFAAAGFFSKALELTGIGKAATALSHLEAMQQPGLFFLVIALLTCGLAVVGVHPVVTISAVASAFTSALTNISTLTFAYMLLAAYGFAVLVSPFSATNLVIAGLFGRSSWEIGPKHNWLYTLFAILVFALIFSFLS